MRSIFSILFIVFCCADADAQSAVTLSTAPIVHIAVDRPGDFYTIDIQKNIKKYNPKGEVIAASTLPKMPTLFDPWSGVRIFTYYAATREIQYLDPTLSLHSILVIDSAFAIEPFLACPSGEYNYWVLDQADFSLKKIITRESKVQTEVLVGNDLTSPDAVLHMREYLNYLFILDKEKGIVIFNQLGIKINQKPVRTDSFGFYGEELYFFENNKVVLYDLYADSFKEMPFTITADGVILLQDKMVSVRENTIEITDFKR